MKYLNLGNTGVEVSELCLGTWKFGDKHDRDQEAVDRQQAHTLLEQAWSSGINFIDTANIYGEGRSESYIGEWMETKERENFIIASKVFFALKGRQRTGLSRKIIRSEIDGTLQRLRTDYVDIYYIHGWHETSPLEETLSTLNDLVHAGKVHYLGVSNFSSAQLYKSAWIIDKHGWVPISVVQPRYSAADHIPFTVDPSEQGLPDLFDACRDLSLAVCPYAPLAGGFLSGKYEKRPSGDVAIPAGSRADVSDWYGTFPDRWWKVLEAIKRVASELGATPAQVALAWAGKIEGLTSIPIFGGKSVDQLEENIASIEISLKASQYEAIWEAGRYTGSDNPY